MVMQTLQGSPSRAVIIQVFERTERYIWEYGKIRREGQSYEAEKRAEELRETAFNDLREILKWEVEITMDVRKVKEGDTLVHDVGVSDKCEECTAVETQGTKDVAGPQDAGGSV